MLEKCHNLDFFSKAVKLLTAHFLSAAFDGDLFKVSVFAWLTLDFFHHFPMHHHSAKGPFAKQAFSLLFGFSMHCVVILGLLGKL